MWDLFYKLHFWRHFYLGVCLSGWRAFRWLSLFVHWLGTVTVQSECENSTGSGGEQECSGVPKINYSRILRERIRMFPFLCDATELNFLLSFCMHSSLAGSIILWPFCRKIKMQKNCALTRKIHFTFTLLSISFFA